jgi:hypothetical protein
MRLAVGLGLAFAASGCVDGGEHAAHVRTARDARFDESVPATSYVGPRVEDRFDEAASMTVRMTPAERAPSRSLGYLGDEPIGRLPTPPHREPADWARPFPCHWTSTCLMVPPRPYYPPSVEVYPGD